MHSVEPEQEPPRDERRGGARLAALGALGGGLAATIAVAVTLGGHDAEERPAPRAQGRAPRPALPAAERRSDALIPPSWPAPALAAPRWVRSRPSRPGRPAAGTPLPLAARVSLTKPPLTRAAPAPLRALPAPGPSEAQREFGIER